MRIGIGYDIHPMTTGRKLVLAGLEIPHTKGLDGHSDADVLTHAVCDALLGAMGEGDIGTHFPASEPRYKGIASLKLEGGRGLGSHLQHPAPVEAHPIVLDPHPGPKQEVARAGVKEVDADLLEDRHRLAVDRLHVPRGEDVVRLEAVLPHGCVK